MPSCATIEPNRGMFQERKPETAQNSAVSRHATPSLSTKRQKRAAHFSAVFRPASQPHPLQQGAIEWKAMKFSVRERSWSATIRPRQSIQTYRKEHKSDLRNDPLPGVRRLPHRDRQGARRVHQRRSRSDARCLPAAKARPYPAQLRRALKIQTGRSF